MDELTVLTWRVPTANADILEAATLPEKDAQRFLERIKQVTHARELVYVPTCQRVLLTLHGASETVTDDLRALYANEVGRNVPEPETFRGRDAFHHLCEVAASLDSLVLGEPQVLGQFKTAVAASDEQGHAGPALRHAFSVVFRAAKAVRSQTELFRGKVSLVPLTETLVTKALAGKERPRVAILGTGQIGDKMIELFQRHGDIEFHIVSRNLARANEVAAGCEGTGHKLDAFLENVPEGLDCIALAMRTETPILTAKMLEILAHNHPVLVLDLALPRNAERPEYGVPGLQLVQMDDLTSMSRENRERRESEYAAAREVLDRELARIEREYDERKLTHDLASLTRRFDEVASERIARAAQDAGLAADDPAVAKWYEQTVRALLHEATSALKTRGRSKGGAR